MQEAAAAAFRRGSGAAARDVSGHLALYYGAFCPCTRGRSLARRAPPVRRVCTQGQLAASTIRASGAAALASGTLVMGTLCPLRRSWEEPGRWRCQLTGGRRRRETPDALGPAWFFLLGCVDDGEQLWLLWARSLTSEFGTAQGALDRPSVRRLLDDVLPVVGQVHGGLALPVAHGDSAPWRSLHLVDLREDGFHHG